MFTANWNSHLRTLFALIPLLVLSKSISLVTAHPPTPPYFPLLKKSKKHSWDKIKLRMVWDG